MGEIEVTNYLLENIFIALSMALSLDTNGTIILSDTGLDQHTLHVISSEVDYDYDDGDLTTRSLAEDPKVISEVDSGTAVFFIIVGLLSNITLMVMLLVRWRNERKNTIHVLKNIVLVNLIQSCL